MSYEVLGQLDNAIKRLVDREVSISAATRQQASTTQQYLRQTLRAKSGSDAQFPFLLQNSDEDFLGGSFARHTKIWPLDDIDLYVPLDGAGLFYHEHGQRLPFIISSDDHNRPNRLTTYTKWMSGTDVDPAKVLYGMKAAVDTTYPTSQTELHAQAVNLQLSVSANIASNGISLDIVPCFRLLPRDNSEPFYLIPNGTGGWMRTNPRKDNELSVELHAYHHQTYRKAIRLVKFWNLEKMNSAFSSYYLELAICKKFMSLRSAGSSIGSNTWALYYAFMAVRDSYLAGNIQPLVVGAPTIVGPLLTLDQRQRLEGVTGLVGTAITLAFNDSNLQLAAASLQQAFGVEVA